jgi:formate dehydrogenase (coenzyme F420) beta subunit
MSEELRNKARELLKTKKVDIIIGYQRAFDGISAKPCFIDNENDVDSLVWDAYCVYNLANYLKDYPEKKAAIVVKKCDLRSIAVLLQENQVKRENVFILEMECQGVIDEKRLGSANPRVQGISFAKKCKKCPAATILAGDYIIKDKGKIMKAPDDYDEYEPVRKMEAKAISERLEFWGKEFSRCIRCYACRQVCPMCYCPKCVADQAMPQWFSKAAAKGNFSWNVARAMHLAGRCVDCGECERACPVGIPLREINKKIEKDVKELFHYEAGANPEMAPLFACFDKSDPDKFIK